VPVASAAAAPQPFPTMNKRLERTMTDAYKSFGDWGKAMMSIDLTKGSEELFNFMAGLEVPGVNMDALVASQRYNLEALADANRAAADGFKAAAEWQKRVFEETLKALSEAIAALSKAGTPQTMAVTQSELATKAMATAVGQMRELAQILTDANRQANDAIAQRVPEGLGEIKDVLKIAV
jgi:phasin family protein